MDQPQKVNWYDKKWLVIILCFTLFPVGLYGLWKSYTIQVELRIALTILISLVLIIVLNNNTKKRQSSTEIKETPSKVLTTKRVDRNSFEILTTEHFPAAENFHLLIKNKSLSYDSLQVLTDMFRREYCTKQCNIHLYDEKSIVSLITKYPIEGKEYLSVADHYVANSLFETPKLWLYPFQDFHYKELGGKNWKKEPIK